MDIKAKEYLIKRNQIIKIIETIKCTYETDECYHELSPSVYECISQAELILKKFGINKPDFLKKEEMRSMSYIIHGYKLEQDCKQFSRRIIPSPQQPSKDEAYMRTSMDTDLQQTDIGRSASHYIQFGIHLNERLGIKSVTIDHNTTDLPSDSQLIKIVAITLLKAIHLNKEDIMLQDLFNELDINRQP